jgi:hypothetical protein
MDRLSYRVTNTKPSSRFRQVIVLLLSVIIGILISVTVNA